MSEECRLSGGGLEFRRFTCTLVHWGSAKIMESSVGANTCDTVQT